MNEIANVKGWYVKAMIKIGVWLPVYGSWLRSMGQAVKPDAQACLETAKEAERLGCDFVTPHTSSMTVYTMLHKTQNICFLLGFIIHFFPFFR